MSERNFFDMFDHLNSFMQHFENDVHIPIQIPNDPTPKSPRDLMLKNPENNSTTDDETIPSIKKIPPQTGIYKFAFPRIDPFLKDSKIGDNWDDENECDCDRRRSEDNFSDFGNFNHSFGNLNPFSSIMGDLFEKFDAFQSDMFNKSFSPSWGEYTYEDNKQDRDLDESEENSLAVFKNRPLFEFDPENNVGKSRKFHSTSIVRIRRPDGVIEETRKYRDSEGNEEVTVTTSEPRLEENDNQTSISPPNSDHLLKSKWKSFPIFSWFFPK